MNPSETMNPIETALLARLIVTARRPPSETEVMKSLRPLFAHASDVDGLLRAGLDRLAAEGLRSPDAMTLTGKGQRKATALLGLKAGTKATWPRVKASLVELALGRAPAEGGRLLGAGAIRALAVASKLGLDTKSTRPAEVLDAWAARELGMARQRLTIPNVRAFALSRALGLESLRDEPKRVGTVAIAHVLGVPRTDAGLVRDAVLRDWLEASRARSKSEASSDRTELDSFATTVKEIARATDDGRFGRHKVFIAPIWKRAKSSFGAMNEREFKSKLVDAHRAGLLRLARADLTPAMAPELVEASEVPYLNAVFHFVDLEGSLS